MAGLEDFVPLTTPSNYGLSDFEPLKPAKPAEKKPVAAPIDPSLNVAQEMAHNLGQEALGGKTAVKVQIEPNGQSAGATYSIPTAAPAEEPPPQWEQIAAAPKFRAMPLERQEQIRAQYFLDFIAPKVPTDQLDAAKASFDKDTKPTFFQRAANAVLNPTQATEAIASPEEIAQPSPLEKSVMARYDKLSEAKRDEIASRITRETASPAELAFLNHHERVKPIVAKQVADSFPAGPPRPGPTYQNLAIQESSPEAVARAQEQVKAAAKRVDDQIKEQAQGSYHESLMRGFGVIEQSAAARSISIKAKLAEVADRIDRGERVQDTEDAVGYQYMTPEQRQKYRADLTASLGESIQSLNTHLKTLADIPQPKAVTDFTKSKTMEQAWDSFKAAPLDIIAHLGLESAPASAQMMAGALLGGAVAGPGGAAAGMGASSAVSEYGNAIIEGLTDAGVDVTDMEAVKKAVQNPALMEKVRKAAFTKSAVVGGFDAVAGVAAGKTMAPAQMIATSPMKAEAVNIAAQAPVQGVLGAGGEVVGSALANKETTPGEAGAEFVGEFATTPMDIASMALFRKRLAKSSTGAHSGAKTPGEPRQTDGLQGANAAEKPGKTADKSGSSQFADSKQAGESSISSTGAAPEAKTPETPRQSTTSASDIAAAVEEIDTVDAGASEAAVSPTNDKTASKDQILAGNAELGHVKVANQRVSVENPAGSTRQDLKNDPPLWKTEMEDHYGYFVGTKARAPDKEHVDVYIKKGTPVDYSGPAFVVDQNKGNGQFDEPKVMQGYDTLEEAKAAYLRHYEPGWESRIRGITQLTQEELDARLDSDKAFMHPQRADAAQRKKVADMTPEERATALLTDDLTGLPNRRAYNEAERLPVQVRTDLDDFKGKNDTYGHDNGDVILKITADALKKHKKGGRVYRIGGDEFPGEFNNADEARAAMQLVQGELARKEIEVTFEGKKHIIKGIGFSYGIGQDEASAEAALIADKAKRKAAGLRSGVRPDAAGTEAAAGSGGQDNSGSGRGGVDGSDLVGRNQAGRDEGQVKKTPASAGVYVSAALKAANEELARQAKFDVEEEIKSISQNESGHLQDLNDPPYWDAENEEFTQAGFDEIDRRTRALAEERKGHREATELSDLNNADQTAQAAAFAAYAEAQGLDTNSDYSSGGSRYVTVKIGEKDYKYRFADHFNTVRDTTQQPDFNVAPGRSDFTEAIAHLDALKNAAPAGSSDNSSQGTPQSGMQERPAVRADDSGSPEEPAQSGVAGGGNGNATANTAAPQVIILGNYGLMPSKNNSALTLKKTDSGYTLFQGEHEALDGETGKPITYASIDEAVADVKAERKRGKDRRFLSDKQGIFLAPEFKEDKPSSNLPELPKDSPETMTLAQYVARTKANYGKLAPGKILEQDMRTPEAMAEFALQHMDFIESALEAGKTVPDEAFQGHDTIDEKAYPLAAKRAEGVDRTNPLAEDGQQDELDAEMRSYEDKKAPTYSGEPNEKAKPSPREELANLEQNHKDKKRFANNKLFTADKVKAARERMKKKFGTLNSGIDPELLTDGMTLAGAYIEAGVRDFAAYAKAMVDDFGDGVKPYLLSFYEAVRHYPGLENDGMSSPDVAAKQHAALITPEVEKAAAKAIGTKPKERKNATADPTRTIRQDWGVPHIDGWTEIEGGKNQGSDFGLRGGMKDAFLGDAKKYLNDVAGRLRALGFTEHQGKKGKPIPAVNINEGGPAVSGDVILTMRNATHGVYVNIGATTMRGMGLTNHPQGVSIQTRVTRSPNTDQFATNGDNRWVSPDTPVEELVRRLDEQTQPPIADSEMDAQNTDQEAENGTVAPPGLESGDNQASRSDGESARADSRPLDVGLEGQDAGAGEGRPAGGRSESPSGNGEWRPGASAGNESFGQSREDGPVGYRPTASGVNTPPTEFNITDEEAIGEGNIRQKYRDNIAAINLVKELDQSGKRATPEQQSILGKYVGWGGIKGVFNPDNKQWAKEYEELKSLLDEGEYAAARRSMLDAHYTSTDVIDGIYTGLRHLGYSGGRVLEPSIGVGNFLGRMPADLRRESQFVGVELDKITGQIVRHLYPSAKIATPKGFQDVNMPSNSFDLAVGNPPFGSQSIFDANHPDLSKFSLHNFFFAKSIDKLRPGGILGMVVSRYLMDSTDALARTWMAKHARLLGAVRLPYTAFKGNANTEVVTDIIFLQKLGDGVEPNAKEWEDSTEQIIGQDDQGQPVYANVNNWYTKHPENVIGKVSTAGSMYKANEYTVEPAGDDLPGAIERALKRILPSDVYQRGAAVDLDVAGKVDVAIPEHLKPGNYFVTEGVIYRQSTDIAGNAVAVAVDGVKATTADRIRGMVKIRDAMRALMRAERTPGTADSELAAMRKALNQAYDKYVKKSGYLNSIANRRAMADDPDMPLLESLEPDYDAGLRPTSKAVREGGESPRPASAKKADIFTKRVLEPEMVVTSARNGKDALIASLNRFGKIDTDYIEQIYGKSWNDVAAELSGLVYNDPEAGWVTADEYLSGNVKAKLRIAKAQKGDFAENIKALEAVQPADLPPTKIAVRLGSTWLPDDVMEKFLGEQLKTGGVSAKYVKEVAKWFISVSGANETINKSEIGTRRLSAVELVGKIINNQEIVVKDNHGTSDQPNLVVNEAETELARAKADEIRNRFKDWIWNDGERADRLARFYNDNYNTNRDRVFDGSHLTLPGSNPGITLRKSQKDAIWRALNDRVVLLDHVVGAGKTFIMSAIAMELRRMGIAKKPMLVVPNHLVRAWRDEIFRLYPSANVLVATEKDFEKANRRRLFARITTGDWDAVVIGHSAVKKIGLPAESEAKVINETLTDLSMAIQRLKDDRGDRNVIKDMQRIEDNLKAKLARIKDKAGAKDDVVNFDELGVDAMMVDELHEFKNLFFYTQMQKVSGLGSPGGSGKAFDLFVKFRNLVDRFGERAVRIGATGTPVSNSLVEMFTMQRYMMYDEMRRQGTHLLDGWAGIYGDVQQVYEVHPSGSGYRMATRFAKFVNLQSLLRQYKSFADIITMDTLKQQSKDAGKVFPVPKVKGGKPQNVVAERSALQEKLFGIPEFLRDDKGDIAFELAGEPNTYDLQKDEKTGKWSYGLAGEKYRLRGNFESENEARQALAMALLTPKTAYNKGSILDQFENLRELTRMTKGKINALSITNRARKGGLDYRLIDPTAEDFPGSKLNMAVKNVKRIYDAWTPDNGTQLVFCDLSVPLAEISKAASKEKEVYVRDKLRIGLKKVKATAHNIPGVDAVFYIAKSGDGFVAYDALTGVQADADHDKKQLIESLRQSADRGGQSWLEALRGHDDILTDEAIQEWKDEHEAAKDEDDSDGEAVSLSDVLALAGSTGRFSVYDDMKAKLIAAGIPAEQIAFIHDYDTSIKKAELFKKVNEGKIRVLFGSTPKMGAGTNVQKRLVALHHLDAPWRPSDLEQRDGRGVRQGNLLYERDPDGFEIELLRYATKQTYDTRMWQIIEHKANGVEQLRKAGADINEIEDIAGEAASSADMKAAASGNPLILEEIKLRNLAKSLQAQRDGWTSGKIDLQRKLRYLRESAPKNFMEKENEIRSLIAVRDNSTTPEFSIRVGDKNYTDKKEAGKALVKVVSDMLKGNIPKETLGRYRGFTIKAEFWSNLKTLDVVIVSDQVEMRVLNLHIEKEEFSPSGLITRIDNRLANFENVIKEMRDDLESEQKAIPEIEAQLAKPFEKEEALQKARRDHQSIVAKLKNAGADVPMTPEMRQELNQRLDTIRRKMEAAGLPTKFDEGDAGKFNLVDAPARMAQNRSNGSTSSDIERLRRALDREGGKPVAPGSVRRVQLPDHQNLGKIAAAFGKRIVGFEQDDGVLAINGMTYPGGDVIYINANATRPHLAVLGHEMGHQLRNESPAEYDRLVDFVRQYVRQDKYRAEFMRKFPGMHDDGIREEFIGEVISDGFTNDTFWQAVGSYNPTLLSRILDVLKSMLAKIRAALKPYTPKTDRYLTDYTKVMRAAGEAMGRYQVRELPKFIEDAVIAAGGNPKTIKIITEEQRSEYARRYGPPNAIGDPADVRTIFGKSSSLFIDDATGKPVAVLIRNHPLSAKFHKAWHGSPHDHDKFTTAKMGTGEGAQAYGWGMYFAGRQDVGKYYRDKLTAQRNLEFLTQGDAETLRQDPKWPDGVPNDLFDDMEVDEYSINPDNPHVRLSWADVMRYIESYGGDALEYAKSAMERYYFDTEFKFGRLYEVELAPKEDEYLDWDKPLYEQGESVIKALANNGFAEVSEKDLRVEGMFDRNGKQIGFMVFHGNDTAGSGSGQTKEEAINKAKFGSKSGERFYNELSEKLGGDKEASLYLKSIGIPGIRFLDGSSRKAGEGHHNYVIFSDDDVSITAKFNKIDTWGSPEKSKLDNVLYALQDKQIDLKRVIEAVKDTGKQLADTWDAYMKEGLFHGRVAKRVEDFITDELKPLLADMRVNGITMAQLEEYLHARHAKEVNEYIATINPDLPDGGSGMTNEEADAYMEGLSDSMKSRLKPLAKRVDRIIRGNRETLVGYGLESIDTIAAWESKYRHYVPLMRDDDGPGIGQGFSIRGKESKRRVGSTRAVVDIMANIVAQREKAIVRGEKNRVALALYGLAKTNPNPDFWKTDAAPMKKVISKETGQVVEVVDDNYKSQDNVIVAKYTTKAGNVRERTIIFNKGDERALRMARALKNLDGQQIGEMLTAIGKATRFLASVNTQYNPIFGVVNLIRDTGSAVFNLTTTEIAGKQKQVIGHVPSALFGVYADSRKVRKGEHPHSKWADLWEEYQLEGGQTAFRQSFASTGERTEALQEEIKSLDEGNAKKIGKGILGWLSDYNLAMENAIRLSAYKVGIDSGMTKERAAWMAKNLTVNFNKKGELGVQAGALYAFFNASVQGTARLAETLNGPQGRRIIAGGVLMGVMQAIALAASGFDDNEPPDFVRDKNLIIPIGGKRYLSIPMPLGFHVLPAFGRRVTEFAMSGGRDPAKKLTELIGVITDSFNPVGNSNSIIQTVSPTVFDPIAAVAANKDWTGRPIAKEDFNPNKPTPGHSRAKDTATPWARGIAYAINAITGGTEFSPGAMSPTPDQIDYLIGQVTGGIGREVSKGITTASALKTGDELPTHKIPLIGRFYGDSESTTAEKSKFFQNVKRLSSVELEIRGRAAKGIDTRQYRSEHPEAGLAFQGQNIADRINDLEKNRKRLIEKGDRARAKEIEAAMIARMKWFNEEVEKVTRR